MMRILEPNFVSNLTNRFTCTRQQYLYTIDNGKMNVFDGWLSCFFLDKVAEIVGWEMKLVSTPCYCGQTILFRLVWIKVIKHQCLKTCKYIAVDNLTCGKLTVIKTKTMIEQDFNIRSKNAATMLVDCVMQFFLYFSKAVENSLSFTLGHMQSFIYFVRKKSIFLHFTSQACAAQQIWMEQ